MTVGDIVGEPIAFHGIATGKEKRNRVIKILEQVGLRSGMISRFPHEFSGGQRQRVGIARALALQPELLICDEPVSSLDVSIQAQILNLLKDLQSELGLTFLFISHNLAVVDYMADRIAVMCRGRLVEVAPRAALFSSPVHPYTQTLLAAVPYPDPARKLDYAHLSASKASSLADFPAPFGLTGSEGSALIDLGDGHYVRAAAGSKAEVLLS